jgi:Ribbon-helix-helix protein, copG family
MESTSENRIGLNFTAAATAGHSQSRHIIVRVLLAGLFFPVQIRYIMKRTQLYLDENIWKALHIQARQRRTSISELVRAAVRDRYGASPTNRRQAMKAIVGIWRDRKDLSDASAYVRQLRKGKRLKRLAS